MKVLKFGVFVGLDGQILEVGLSVFVFEFFVGYKGDKLGLVIGGNIQVFYLEVNFFFVNIEGFEGKLKGFQIIGLLFEGDLGLKGIKL